MQKHEDQSGSGVEINSSAHIKRYRVTNDWCDYDVTLEVDHDELTKETAALINSFWIDDEDRVDEEGGDVVKAVIRLAGQTAISTMLERGGTSFGLGNPSLGETWTDRFYQVEGWGPGCGIRIVGANVEHPSFSDCKLEEFLSE